jgi:hypothetical protein
VSRFTAHLGLWLVEDTDGKPITRNGRCQWRLSGPLPYDVGEEGSGETITIPGGFVTDLASVPKLFRGLLPPDGPWAKAAVVHDFLYWSRGTCRDALGRIQRTRIEPYTRKEADDIFAEAMKVLGVPAWRRKAIWTAVRLGGQGGWGR